MWVGFKNEDVGQTDINRLEICFLSNSIQLIFISFYLMTIDSFIVFFLTCCDIIAGVPCLPRQ